ncbi:MAG: leucine-rich repeat protein [Candidatus Coproplasma sp.]
MKKKIAISILTLLTCLIGASGFAACGSADDGGNGGHVHSYSVTSTVKATCTEEGYTVYSCLCGDSYRADAEEPLGHNLVHVEATEATCSHNGTTAYDYCTRCDYMTAHTETPRLSHDVVTDAAVEATCSEAGLTEGSHCSVCGEIIVAQQEIEKLAHTPVTDAAVEATCTKNGLTEGSHCSVCGEIIVAQQSTPMAEHEYGEDGRCKNCSQVNPENSVSSVKITNETFFVEKGGSVQITYSITPAEALYDEITFEISDNTCGATITEEGLLTCTQEGSVTVTVSVDGTVNATANFFVGKLITTAEEFFNIREDLGGIYTLANDIDLSDYAAWTPIGSLSKKTPTTLDYSKAFSGRFNGDGYVVSGLTVDLSAESCASLVAVGLFGCVAESGSVENLVLKNVTVKGTNAATEYVGGVVGLNKGVISACTVSGSITLENVSAPYVGGIAGESDGKLYDVGSDCVITVTGGTGYNVGGIVGRTKGKEIDGVSVTGKISVESSVAVNAGGVVGYLDVTVANVSVAVELSVRTTGSDNKNNYAGLVAGYSSQEINGISVSGTLTVDSYGKAYVGGIVGYCALNVSDCENNAGMNVKVSNSGNSGSYIGGIVGYTAKDVKNCENNAKISMPLIYGGYIGGIVGSGSSVINCENNGIVSAYVLDESAYLGGVAGMCGTIESCVNNQAITMQFTESKQNYVGGVVGYVRSLLSDCTNNADGETEVTRISNTNDAEFGKQYVGGVAGYVTCGVTDGVDNQVRNVANYASFSVKTNAVVYFGGAIGYVKGNVIRAYSYGYSLELTSSESAATAQNYVGGIIGYLNGSLDTAESISNLTVSKGTVAVGGIAGSAFDEVRSALFSANITVDGTYIDDSNKTTYAGGIAGLASKAVTDCYATGTFIKVSIKNKVFAGGIAGKCDGKVSSSYAYPAISVVSGCTINVGGLCGQASEIEKCYSTGKVSATVTDASDLTAGGLAGLIQVSAKECYASGDLNCYSRSKAYVGGLIGQVQNNAAVQNCYVAYACVETDCSADDPSASGVVYNGGLVGYNKGGIENCYAAAFCRDTASEESNNQTHYVGGLVAGNFGEVSACYVLDATQLFAREGALSGVSGSGVAKAYYAGGLVAYNQGAISDCYSYASVNVNTDGACVGGLVGSNVSSSGAAKISRSIAFGRVTSEGSGAKVGGFAGSSYTDFENCFFVTGLTGQDNPVDGIGFNGITALDESDAASGQTYVNFSGDTWKIADGAYPTLVTGAEWESRTVGNDSLNVLVNVPEKGSQYEFPHASRVIINITRFGGKKEVLEVNKGNTVCLPELLNCRVNTTSYSFCGWATDAEYNNLIQPGMIKVESDQNFYAYYCLDVKQPKSVSYVYTGESISVADVYADCDYYTVSGDFVAADAGEYRLVFKLNKEYCWGNRDIRDYELIWTIEPCTVEIPDIYDVGEYILFVGEETDLAQKYGSEKIVVSGDYYIDGMDALMHTVTLSLSNDSNYVWSDGDNAEKTFSYYLASGVCGDGTAEIIYRYADGGLALMGEGSLSDYVAGESPWYDKIQEITAITVGEGITAIGSYAFSGCSNVTEISLPEGLTSIGNYAFKDCSALLEAVVPDGVTTIGTGAFSGCVSLESVTLPESLTSIGGSAFMDCSSLIEAVVPDGVTTIGSGAFSGCASLESVSLPFVGGSATPAYSAASTLFGYIFGTTEYTGSTATVQRYGNSYYATYYIPSSLTSVAVAGGEIFYGAFYGCSNLTEITLPDNLTSIGTNAFCNCSSLTGITVPDSVTTIGSGAFGGCASLESITLPFVGSSASATSSSSSTLFGYIFGTSALTGTVQVRQYYNLIAYVIYYIPSSLKNVTVTGGKIFYGAFFNCSGLTEVVLGEAVTSIGTRAFYGCSSLESITLPFVGSSAAATDSSSSTLFGYIFGTNSWTGAVTTLQYYSSGSSSTYYVPATLRSVTVTGGEIFYGAFYNCNNLTDITVTANVTAIGDYAFYGCSSLENVTLPESLTSIGDYAFYGCSSLTQASIPEGVTSIGDYAFYGCSSLTQASIPEGVTSIGEYQFYGCSSLESVTLPEGISAIGGYAFMSCGSLAQITLPESLTSIGDYAFADCISIEQLVIPDGVTTLGTEVFYNCKGLTELTLSDGLTEIPEYAFYTCSGLTQVSIPDGVTAINKYAFANCKGITQVSLPEGLTSIGEGAFEGCENLALITLPESLKTIGDYAFSNCSSLTQINIPDGVTALGTYAFNNCSSLTQIDIPDGVTSIGTCAFLGCNSLESITGLENNSVYYVSDNCIITVADKKLIQGCKNSVVPSDVIEIGSYAFSDCTGLIQITIPEGVTTIGNSAFSGCNNLIKAVIGKDVTLISDKAFDGCKKLIEVYNLSSLKIVAGSSTFGSVAYYAQKVYTSLDDESELVTETDDEGFMFLIDGNERILFSYIGTDTRPTVPDGTTAIYQYAFSNNKNLKEVVIPDSVKTIGEGAFSGCSSLESITLPFLGAKAGVTSNDTYQYPLGYIFGSVGYAGGKTVSQQYHGSSLYSSISSVYVIPLSLKKVTVNGGGILSGAFYNCNWIEEVVLGSGVTQIVSGAFSNCSGLTEITVEEGIESIAFGAFYGCSGLTDITLPFVGDSASPNTPSMATLLGAVFGVSSFSGTVSTYQNFSALNGQTYYIPASLTNVTITGGKVLYGAFSNCASLKKVTLGDNVTLVDDEAFGGCTNLKSVILGNGITSVGDYAFRGCYVLADAVIGESVESIGSSAFSDCRGLVEVYNLSSLEIVAGSEDYGCVAKYALCVHSSLDETSQLITDGKGFVYCISGGKKIICGYIGGAAEPVLPDDADGIYSCAFFGCIGITKITLPEGITSIGDYAFCDCSGLTQIILPEGLISIGDYAFCNCSDLTQIILPEGLTSIGDYAFCGCYGLIQINLPDGLITIGESAFEGCGGLTRVTVPDSVTTIGLGAFGGCVGLESITLPFVGGSPTETAASHSTLFGYIFGNCNYGGTVSVVQYCSDISSCNYMIPSSLTSVTVTGGKIFYGAFSYCSMLTDVTVNNVSEIGELAFSGCSALTKVNLSESTLVIGRKAFMQCTDLVLITLPESLTDIGEYAFCQCNLGEINIPANVTSIGDYAFSCNSYLSVITVDEGNTAYCSVGDCLIDIGNKVLVSGCRYSVIPSDGSVTSIAAGAFMGCKYLSQITLPDGIISIGDYAFGGCDKLTEIIIPDSVTTIGNSAFRGCYTMQSVTLGSGLDSIGMCAFTDCNALTSVTFSVTEGWWYSQSETATSGTDVPSDTLENATSAAGLLKDIYYYYRRT